MTTLTAPDWLTRRAGALKPGSDAETWIVTLNGHPAYRLFATPATGSFTCVVTQTNNGKRLDGGKAYATVEATLVGGMEELRERLGW